MSYSELEVFLPLVFSDRECIEIVLILLETFGRIPMKPSGSGDFFFGSF